MDIENVLSISCIFSGIFCLLCVNKKLGENLVGFYKKEECSYPKQIQMLITGLLILGFGFWWVFNPELMVQ